MTDIERAEKAQRHMDLVKLSINSLSEGRKDKDDHIRLLELTIGGLTWLCKQPTIYPEEKECKHTNSHWIGRPWSGVHQCDDCYKEFPVSEEQRIKDMIESGESGEYNLQPTDDTDK